MGLRKKVVHSLKMGAVFNLQMENSAVFIKTEYDSPDCFPVDLVFDPTALFEEENWKKIVRDEDMTFPGVTGKIFVPKEDYRFCITSHFEEEDAKEFLEEALPLDRCEMVVVDYE